MKGTLEESIEKNGKTITRKLNTDRTFKNVEGGETKVHGRSLMLLRNVGHLMTNPAILVDGEEIYEGIMDALVTPLLSVADIRGENTIKNSRTGSMYIVKPKCTVQKKLHLRLSCLNVLNRRLAYLRKP